jgi:hypothetical protein
VPPRAVSLTAPGRLRKPARPVLRLDCEELAARGSSGQARSDSMKRGTEVEPDHTGTCRGGAPEGERSASR